MNVFNAARAAHSRVRLSVSKRQYATAIMKSNPNPTWNEDFLIPVTDPSTEVLFLQLCDAAKLDKKGRGDDCLSACEIRLSGLIRDIPQAFSLQLQMLRPNCVTTLNIIVMPHGFGQNLVEQFCKKESDLREQIRVTQSDSWALMASQFLRKQATLTAAEKQRAEEQRQAALEEARREEERRLEEAARQREEEERRRAEEERLRWDREPFDQEHARQALVRRLHELQLGDAAPEFHEKLAKRMDRLIKKHIAGGQRSGYINQSLNLLDAPNDPEVQVRVWIETLLKIKCQKPIEDWLRNGQLLCHTVNAINPGFIEAAAISDSEDPMQQRSNIRQFLTACKQMGVDETDTFLVDDLFQGKDMKQVLICVKALSNAARYVRGFEGPFIEKMRMHLHK
eukprot:EG_transcript_5628